MSGMNKERDCFFKQSLSFAFDNLLLHSEDGCDERQDGIELRKRSINHRVRLHIVSGSDACDTIRANHTLTDSREEANETHAQTNTEAYNRVG